MKIDFGRMELTRAGCTAWYIAGEGKAKVKGITFARFLAVAAVGGTVFFSKKSCWLTDLLFSLPFFFDTPTPLRYLKPLKTDTHYRSFCRALEDVGHDTWRVCNGPTYPPEIIKSKSMETKHIS